VTGVPQGSILAPILYNLCVNYALTAPNMHFNTNIELTLYRTLVRSVAGAHQSANCMWVSKFLMCNTV
jgi:hypothetical protein